MENRERDRVSQSSTPTEAGRINREVEEKKGREQGDTSAEFGQSIGRSEDLSEGGNMRNKNDNDLKNTNMGNESSRNSGGGSFGSQSGRSGSVDDRSGSNISSSDQSSGRSGSRSGSSSDIDSGSSSGRH